MYIRKVGLLVLLLQVARSTPVPGKDNRTARENVELTVPGVTAEIVAASERPREEPLPDNNDSGHHLKVTGLKTEDKVAEIFSAPPDVLPKAEEKLSVTQEEKHVTAPQEVATKVVVRLPESKAQHKVTAMTSAFSQEANATGNVPVTKTKVSEPLEVKAQTEALEKERAKPTPFAFPDPIDNFANTILLSGHVFGIHDYIMNMLQDVLSSDGYFVPVEPLSVHHWATKFDEMGYEGEKYTTIRYVVSYNGRPVHRDVIHKILSKPEASSQIQHHLDAKQLKEYVHKIKGWSKNHVASVVVPATLGFVLIILIAVFVCTKKSRKAKRKSAEAKMKLVTSGTTGCDEKCPPPPYTAENPAFSSEKSGIVFM